MFGAHLWQIPVVQCDNGCDLVLQQHVNQVVIIFDPFLVDVFACRRGNYQMQIKNQSDSLQTFRPSLFLPVGKILGQEMEKR